MSTRQLTPDEVDLFYKLHTALLCYANQQLQLGLDIEDPEDVVFTPLDEVNTIRQALYADLSLIERFAEANPYHLSPDELDIVRSWVHLSQGSFYIFRYLKRYTVFLDDGDPPHAYGVLGLRSDFDELVGRTLPRLVETVLLQEQTWISSGFAAILSYPPVLPEKQVGAEGVIALGCVTAYLAGDSSHVGWVAIAKGDQEIAIGNADQHPAGDALGPRSHQIRQQNAGGRVAVARLAHHHGLVA